MRNLEKIKTLINSNYDYQNKLKEAKEQVKVWKSTGLLEGLKTDHEVFNMAVLMTNQAKELIKEATETGGAGSEEWSGIALPLVRKVFGEISAKEFVSVQSLSLPSSLVFYLDFKYSDGIAANAKRPGYNQPVGPNDHWNKNSVYGILNTEAGDEDVPQGGFYGIGKYIYSKNTKNFVVPGNADSTFNTEAAFKTFLAGNPHIDSSTHASYTAVTIAIASMPGCDLNAVRSFVITKDTDPTVVINLPEFTKINGANIEFLVKGAFDPAATASKVYYSVQPTAGNRGDFEDKESSAIAIPEIDMDLKSLPVVVTTRKLKAKWTPEMAQDLMAYHIVDAELELTNILSSHIGLEIDLEVLDMLMQKADSIEHWSANPSYEWVGSPTDGSFVSNTQYYINNKADWFQTLGIKLQKVSNIIHQKTMRGGANFVVASPTIATVLETLNAKWSTNAADDTMKFNMGVEKVGTFANQIKVFKNPYLIEDTMLVGYKGNDFLETGAVFAPYIPLMITPLLYDPATFTPRKGVMTRYAKVCVRPEFYAKIYVGSSDLI